MPIFRLLYSRQYFHYISFALFLEVYFVRYIHSSTTLMFPTLYSWKCCSYISYAISMAIWSLSQKMTNGGGKIWQERQTFRKKNIVQLSHGTKTFIEASCIYNIHTVEKNFYSCYFWRFVSRFKLELTLVRTSLQKAK